MIQGRAEPSLLNIFLNNIYYNNLYIYHNKYYWIYDPGDPSGVLIIYCTLNTRYINIFYNKI